jgi:hypothetical protein
VFDCCHVNGHGDAHHQHDAAHHLGRDLDSSISLLQNPKLWLISYFAVIAPQADTVAAHGGTRQRKIPIA